MAQVLYEIKTALKHVEEDIFNEGCIPESSFTVDIDLTLENTSIKELLNSVADFIGIDYEKTRIV